jgi:hypothetical protein
VREKMKINAIVVTKKDGSIVVDPPSYSALDDYPSYVKFNGPAAEKLFNIFRDALNPTKKEGE